MVATGEHSPARTPLSARTCPQQFCVSARSLIMIPALLFAFLDSLEADHASRMINGDQKTMPALVEQRRQSYAIYVHAVYKWRTAYGLCIAVYTSSVFGFQV